MARTTTTPATLHSAAAATAWSTEVDVYDVRNATLVISTANSGDATIKVAGSVLPAGDVDFSSAAAVGNEWDYIETLNLNSGSTTSGDTGVVYAGTDAVEQFNVQFESLRTVAVEISAYAAGNITVKLIKSDNQ